MDCVGCDKCRLWGKLQTVGYGTALKVLFEYDELKNGENPPLRRTELVALVNTLDRVSTSLTALGKMREISIGNAPEPENEVPRMPPERPLRELKGNPNAKAAIAPDFHTDLPGDANDDDEEVIYPEETVWEAFTDEFGLVWRTFLYVIRSWIQMPGKIFRIVVVELSRLWSYWLGLPVQQRSWQIKWPTRDEL